MSRLGYVCQRMFNVPLAIHPRKVSVIMAALAERLGVVSLDGFERRPAPRAFDDDGDGIVINMDGPADVESCYEVVNGVALIPIVGTLVNKSGLMQPYSGMTGYDCVRGNFLQAMEDPDVKGVMFDVESPGGEAAGLFDLVDTIYRARGTKPIWAMLSEYAYSAAYAIASAADRITIPRTGGVGSVGVIVMHADMSQALANAGLKVTLITYGDRKADGHPALPLSDEARVEIQKAVDELGELFVSTVARNLNISKASVIKTQAGSFTAEDALKIGFAHEILSPDEALAALVAKLQES